MQVQREIGRRLREARQAADLTQERAAAEAGIDYKRYQRLEQGSVNPTIRTLVRLAAALRTDFWSLVAGGPDELDGSAWYPQKIAAGQGLTRGLRIGDRGTDAACEVSISRLVHATRARVVEALRNEEERASWLEGADPALAAALETALAGEGARLVEDGDRSRLHIGWGESEVELWIVGKPGGRSRVIAQNRRLSSEAEVEERRASWKLALDALRSHFG